MSNHSEMPDPIIGFAMGIGVPVAKVTPTQPQEIEDQYNRLLILVNNRVNETLKSGQPIFKTTATSLFDLFLEGIPAGFRQHYNCRNCQSFIDTYGGLVILDERGSKTPVCWSQTWDLPAVFFHGSIRSICLMIDKAAVTGQFFSEAPRAWGNPVNGSRNGNVWNHFHAILSRPQFKHHLLTADQMMADAKERYRMLSRALANFPSSLAVRAQAILSSSDVYRREAISGKADWFLRVHNALVGMTGRQRHHIVWHFVANAPPDFCHVSGSLFGSFLQDLKDGVSASLALAGLKEKLDPTKYMRPQAPATEGNIKRAEEIVQKLGIEKSLERRWAGYEDIRFIWEPQAQEYAPPTTGVFDHLKKTNLAASPEFLPRITMTWKKFNREVLPAAKNINIHIGDLPQNFAFLLTAVHQDAPPILQWDNPGRRNPVSWYLYKNGILPRVANLAGNRWYEVSGICLQPPQWYEDCNPKWGRSAILLIRQVLDTRGGSLALFPEILRSELHEIRATIEAHSREKKPDSIDGDRAGGIKIEDQGPINVLLKVTTPLFCREIFIDRWD